MVEATVSVAGVPAADAPTNAPLAVHKDLSTKLDVSAATICQALPVYTFIAGIAVLKYKAPVISGLPSLSTDGSEAFAPRYLSSKLS